jgi:hypothetical protein
MTTPTVESTNWSGAVITAPSGESFSIVSAEWVVPTLAQVPIKGVTTSDVAEWVGIDGYQSNDVCQAGVIETVQTSGGKTTISCSAFAEWYPAYADIIPTSSFKVNPGDTIKVTVETSGAGATQATFIFQDLSNHNNADNTYKITLTAPTGTHLQGNSAEFVVETPELSNGYQVTQPLLSDFTSPIVFQDVSATLVSTKGVDSAASLSSASAETISMWTEDVPGSQGYVEEAYGSIVSSADEVTVTEDNYWPAASSGSTLFGSDYYF